MCRGTHRRPGEGGLGSRSRSRIRCERRRTNGAEEEPPDPVPEMESGLEPANALEPDTRLPAARLARFLVVGTVVVVQEVLEDDDVESSITGVSIEELLDLFFEEVVDVVFSVIVLETDVELEFELVDDDNDDDGEVAVVFVVVVEVVEEADWRVSDNVFWSDPAAATSCVSSATQLLLFSFLVFCCGKAVCSEASRNNNPPGPHPRNKNLLSFSRYPKSSPLSSNSSLKSSKTTTALRFDTPFPEAAAAARNDTGDNGALAYDRATDRVNRRGLGPNTIEAAAVCSSSSDRLTSSAPTERPSRIESAADGDNPPLAPPLLWMLLIVVLRAGDDG